MSHVKKELELAREVQQRTYPSSIPAVAGFEVFAKTTPASFANGDFYDIIGMKPREDAEGFIHDTSAQVDHLLLTLGDATGHGVASALMAIELRSMLRVSLRLGVHYQTLFSVLNDQLCDDMHAGRFITCLCGRLEPVKNMFRWVSFGQGPVWFYRAAEQTVEVCLPHLPPLGILPDMSKDYVPTETCFESGDALLILSDGFPETKNKEGDLLGDEALIECFRENAAVHPEKILEALWQRMENHADGVPQADDRTFLFIRKS